MKKVIDLSTYKRIDHFNYFRTLSNQSIGTTVDIDVTGLVEYCKKNKYSFYLMFMHCAALAADEIPELRQRIENDQIVEYDECPTSHIEPLDDGTYCYCTLHHHMPLCEFIEKADIARKNAINMPSIKEDEDVDSMYFVTCLPWFKYSQFYQPSNNESNPRISWGKHEPDYKNRLMMPVTILVNHALVDGLQIAKFYENLDKQISLITK